MLKRIFKIVLITLLILFIFSLIPYAFCPVYDFSERIPFSGNSLYNPYSNLNPDNWLKINFHAHTYVWYGLTDGRKNDVSDLDKLYKDLDYDVICFSDYQSINNYMKDSKCFIPVYEHGYGIFKNHQLIIGADNVVWTDYLYFQTKHQKQDIINRIKKRNNIICLNHPNLRNAYDYDDMRNLIGYDYLEIVNPYQENAVKLWDDALSSGHRIFALANDDTHNANEDKVIGTSFNLVNSELQPDSILKALNFGNTIAVELSGDENYKLSNLLEKSKNLPVMQKFFISEDTLNISFDRIAEEIVFIGQNGLVKAKIPLSKEAKYFFKDDDTYIRAEVKTGSGSTLYLNPIIRYDPEMDRVSYVKVNLYKTYLLRIFSILIFISLTLLYYNLRKRKRKRVKA